MDYVEDTPDDDGLGNGERYEAVLPAQAQVGDLEYYFVCDSDGYRYQSLDYTGLSYPYPAESDPSWPNQLRGGASEPDGREFYVRLRPYQSPYGAVHVVTDDPAVPPVEMALVGDNRWQGMVPRTDVADTNLSFYFRATRAYVPDADTFSTNTVCWSEAAQTGAGRVPFGGVCVETNDAGRIRVKADSGGYIMVTLNTDTKEYMTRRAEYQNFNAWPAPPEKFSESSGQSAKQSFGNSFETWPVNTETNYSEFFDLISSIPTTNVYSREPFPTPRDWMAGSAAFVVERVDADIYNKPGGWTGITVQNHALRLKGGDSALGLGYVHNTRVSRTDGIKALSFKCRLGQPASNFDVTYDRTGFMKSNYMFKANARVYGSMSPERPSMSVIGYYRDPENFYEYRVSQIRVGTDESRLEHQLYKWENGSPKPLATGATKDNADLISAARSLEMRLFNETTGTRIYCLYNGSSRVNLVELTANSPHTYGTYGFLSADCEAGFSYAQTQPTTTGAALVGSTPVTVLYADNNIVGQMGNWYTPAGRYAFDIDSVPRRIQAVIPDQKLGVYLQTAEPGSDAEPSAPGTTGWKKYQELTVSGFGYSSNAVTVKDWKTQYVMLQVSGMTNTLSVTDVAVDAAVPNQKFFELRSRWMARLGAGGVAIHSFHAKIFLRIDFFIA
ncbi:MAG: hypothetical protein PHV28_03835, partial [Kiritimatiellae bacterium]|nr:hypothetical protein [Kiritimatiellia bacterium]